MVEYAIRTTGCTREISVGKENRSKEQDTSPTIDRSKKRLPALPATTIRPSRGWVPVNLKEVIRFRELLYFLIWGDIKVRYKQTALGAGWAVIHPFAIMVVFTVFFGMVIKVPTGEIPYPIFAYSGLVVWTYFANALTRSSNSLVEYESLITKVYFPRLLVPVASVAAGLVDFLIAFAVLVGLASFYGFVPTASIWLLPLFMLTAIATALAVSLWLSALNVKYRDVGLLVPVLTQLWFFATPIIYPSNLLPEEWRPLYEAINPMVGVVEGFRWAVLGTGQPPSSMFSVTVLMVAALLVGGLYYFRRTERIFADVV